jgi:hypothetical protein
MPSGDAGAVRRLFKKKGDRREKSGLRSEWEALYVLMYLFRVFFNVTIPQKHPFYTRGMEPK